MFFIFFIFLCGQAAANELTLEDPNHLPTLDGYKAELSVRKNHREIEYESKNVRIDQQDYRSTIYDLKVLHSPLRRLSVGALASFDPKRKYMRSFGPESPLYGQPAYVGSSRGFSEPELIAAFDFEPESTGWIQQAYIQFNPIKLKASPNRNFRGGHDVMLEYRFGHLYSHGSMHGRLYSHYFGRKHFHLPGDPRKSITDAYTEVGIYLGYTHRISSNWRFRATGNFGLTSDYKITTPEIRREADKGYHIGTEGELSYFVRPNFLIGTRARTEALVYNANNERLSRNIDYEIEEVNFGLFISSEWGGVQ